MTPKAREYYRAKAAQYEERARKTRSPDREWHMICARAYRKLAEMESEVAAQCGLAADVTPSVTKPAQTNLPPNPDRGK
jgi:hypothetical protein